MLERFSWVVQQTKDLFWKQIDICALPHVPDLWKWFEFYFESFPTSSHISHHTTLILLLSVLNGFGYVGNTFGATYYILASTFLTLSGSKTNCIYRTAFLRISLSRFIQSTESSSIWHIRIDTHTLHKSTNFQLINNWNAEKMNFMFWNHIFLAMHVSNSLHSPISCPENHTSNTAYLFSPKLNVSCVNKNRIFTYTCPWNEDKCGANGYTKIQRVLQAQTHFKSSGILFTYTLVSALPIYIIYER